MKTKRKIAALIATVVFTGLIICPALARKYDTMIVGADRWIDNSPNQKICEQTNEIVFNSSTNEKSKIMAFTETQGEPNVITYYDGQIEPNLVILIYYPDEHPEHPNEIIYEDDLEPNVATLYANPDEPNEVSSEVEVDPNDIEKIILDEGTANHRKEESILPDLS